MKKIGFIDYYIDEWHADNFPGFVKDSSRARDFKIHLAWQLAELEGKKPLKDWCAEQGVGEAESIEQVVEECDGIVVLSPDNAEKHEELADLPLKSGKPVYIDKPFAPALDAAQRLFAKAEEHKTPLMSASALRYGSAVEKLYKKDIGAGKANYVSVRGPGLFHIYAVHQLEMLVMLMGTGATRVQQVGCEHAVQMVIDYADKRRGSINLMPGHPFALSAVYGEGKSVSIEGMDDTFPRFIEAVLAFLDTGKATVPKEETLEIVALIEAGEKGMRKMNQWVDVSS